MARGDGLGPTCPMDSGYSQCCPLVREQAQEATAWPRARSTAAGAPRDPAARIPTREPQAADPALSVSPATAQLPRVGTSRHAASA